VSHDAATIPPANAAAGGKSGAAASDRSVTHIRHPLKSHNKMRTHGRQTSAGRSNAYHSDATQAQPPGPSPARASQSERAACHPGPAGVLAAGPSRPGSGDALGGLAPGERAEPTPGSRPDRGTKKKSPGAPGRH
jgi:hypothetical protein